MGDLAPDRVRRQEPGVGGGAARWTWARWKTKAKSQPESQRRSDENRWDALSDTLKDTVKEVRVTHRLTESPALPGGGRTRHEQPLAAHAQGSWPDDAGEQAGF